MPDSIQKLYEATTQHYDVGDYDSFSSKMSKPESRTKVYEALSQHYDLGDYETFNQKITAANMPSGMEDPQQLEAQPGYEEEQQQAMSQEQQQAEPETPQQMVGRFVQDSVANDPFLAGLDVDIEDQLADLDDLLSYPESTGIPTEPGFDAQQAPVADGTEQVEEGPGFLESAGEAFKGQMESVDIDIAGFDVAFKGAAGVEGWEEEEAALIEARGQNQERMAEHQALQDEKGFIEKSAIGAVGMVGPMAKGTLEGLILGGITAAAGQAGPQVFTPEEIVTVPLATMVGAGQYWYRQGMGDVYLTLREKGVDPKIARTAAGIVAPMYAAIEFSQIGKIVPGLQPLLKKKAIDSVTKIVAKAISKYGTDVVVETGEEVVQEVLMVAADEGGKAVSNALDDTNLKQTPVKQVWDRLWSTMKETVGPMMFLLGPKRAQGIAQEISARKELENQVDKLDLRQRNALGLTNKKLKDDFGIDLKGKETKGDVRLAKEEMTDVRKTVAESFLPKDDKADGEIAKADKSKSKAAMVDSFTDTDALVRDAADAEAAHIGGIEKSKLETEREIDETTSEDRKRYSRKFMSDLEARSEEEKSEIFDNTKQAMDDHFSTHEPEKLEAVRKEMEGAKTSKELEGIWKRAKKKDYGVAVEAEPTAEYEAEIDDILGALPEDEVVEAAPEEGAPAIVEGEIAPEEAPVEPAVVEKVEVEAKATPEVRQAKEMSAGKDYDGIQKLIDDREDKLEAQGIKGYEEASKDPLLTALYEQRFAVERKDMSELHGNIVSKIRGEGPALTVAPKGFPSGRENELQLSDDRLAFILKDSFGIDPKSQTSTYFASQAVERFFGPEYRAKENLKREHETITQGLVKNWAEANSLDSDGIFSPSSSYSKQTQQAILKHFSGMATNIIETVHGELLVATGTTAEKVTLKVTGAELAVAPVSEEVEKKSEPEILVTGHGNPYKTEKTAQIRADKLGEGYSVVPVKGGFGVQKGEVVEAAPVDEIAPDQVAESELDKYEQDMENEETPLSTKSVRPAGEPGMGVIDLERSLATVKGKYHIPIKIVGSIEDLPTERLRAAVEKAQKKGTIVGGVYHEGSVYLIGDGIRDGNEALLVLSHEVVGHGGVELLLGKKNFARLLKDLQRDKFISPVIEKMAKDNKWTGDKAAKEWFANRAEGKNFDELPDSLIKRIIYWFKQGLRKTFGARAVRFSDADITNLIRRSYQYAQKPKAAKAAAKAAEGENTSTLMRSEEAHQEWYSQMQTIADKKLPGKGTVPGFRKMIESWANKGEFKAEELQWSGLLDDPTSPLAKDVGKVTKQEVVDWLSTNNVQVEEVKKGMGKPTPETGETFTTRGGVRLRRIQPPVDADQNFLLFNIFTENALTGAQDYYGIDNFSMDNTKFSSHQLPGGENYREILIKLPGYKGKRRYEVYPASSGDKRGVIAVYDNTKDAIAHVHREPGLTFIEKTPEAANEFTGAHFDEPNVVVHLRLNDRTGPNGERILFVEEVQSDWHQKGREEGYQGKPLSTTERQRLRALEDRAFDDPENKRSAEEKAELAELMRRGGQSGVPSAPFKKTWPILAMKKALRMAAEGGYDSVAWTTGEQQASRYDLSKQIDYIGYQKRGKLFNLSVGGKGGGEIMREDSADEQWVKDNLGKEMLEKMKADEGRSEAVPGGTIRYLEDLDLKVGGEGMKGFYDKMLPAAVNKYVKKWGGKSATTEIDLANDASFNEEQDYHDIAVMDVLMSGGEVYVKSQEDSNESLIRNLDELQEYKNDVGYPTRYILGDVGGKASVHSLTITPAMRQAALMGQPLFRTQSVNENLKQLQGVEKALADLPATRNNKPTTAFRERLEAKRDEIEERIADEGVSFRARQEGSLLERRTKALETAMMQDFAESVKRGLMNETTQKDYIRKHTSSIIRDHIKALREGSRLGRTDLKKELKEVTSFILNYTKQYLPKTGLTRGQVEPLLRAVATAENADDMLKAYNRVDAILRTVTSKKLVSDIDKLLKRYKPKKKGGRLEGKVLTADEYKELGDIRVVMKMSNDDIAESLEEATKRMTLRAGDDTQSTGGAATSAEEELLAHMGLFGDLKHKTVAELEIAKANIESIIATGKAKRKDVDDAFKAAMGELKDEAVEYITEGKGILTQHQIRAQGGPKIEGFVRKTYQGQLTLEFMLDELSRNEKGVTPLRGTLNNFFMPKIQDARNAETKGIREGMEMFQNKLAEIYGTTNPKDLEKKGIENSKSEDLGITIEQNGQQVPIILSQEEAYKQWQEWQDHTQDETFAKMGYTQETMDAIEKFIKPEVKQWAEWQIYEFYPQYYATINKVFRERYGVDLPYNPSYTPISKVYEGSDKQDDQLLTDRTAMVSSVLNNHLKGRVKNTRPLQIIGGDTVLIRHLIEMEHFKAWAEPMRSLRSFFGDERIRTAIKQNFGPNLLKRIDDTIDTVARGGIDPKKVNDLLDKLRKNFTTSVLGLNFTLIPKQLASIPAYAAHIPAANFVSGTMGFMISPREKVKILAKSEMMIARYGLGFERDMMLALQRSERQQLSGKRNWRDKFMFPTKMGDRVAIMVGGWSVYKYHYDLAKADNKSDAEAEKIAMYEFERATSRTQQSGNPEDLPSIMQGGSWNRAFTMFQTAISSYFRMEATPLLNLKRGRGSKAAALKQLAIAHFILPTFFQWIASGLKWDNDDQLRANILGSFNGILAFGQALEGLTQMAISKFNGSGSYFFGISSSPVLTTADEAQAALGDIAKLIGEGDVSLNDVRKVLHKSMKVASKVKGIPYAAPARMIEGIYEGVTTSRWDDGLAKGLYEGIIAGRWDARKIAGFSKSALHEKGVKRELMDELEAYSELPRGEQDKAELAKIEERIDAYNKAAHKHDESLIKKTDVARLKKTPRQVAAGLLDSSSSRALSDASAKKFRNKAELALENGEIKQKLYDRWVELFEKNQERLKRIKQSYYEKGEEVPRKSRRQPGAPRPPRQPRPKRRPLNR